MKKISQALISVSDKRNLNKILSVIHKSRSSHHGASFALIDEYNSDLLCLSGGRYGICGLNSLYNPLETTREIIQKISSIYTDRFYVEIDRTRRSKEDEYNNIALSIAKENDLPLVASNDVLFMTDSDYEANEVKVSIIKKTKLDDRVNQDDYSPNQYFKTKDEMSTLFKDQPSALKNIRYTIF